MSCHPDARESTTDSITLLLTLNTHRFGSSAACRRTFSFLEVQPSTARKGRNECDMSCIFICRSGKHWHGVLCNCLPLTVTTLAAVCSLHLVVCFTVLEDACLSSCPQLKYTSPVQKRTLSTSRLITSEALNLCAVSIVPERSAASVLRPQRVHLFSLKAPFPLKDPGITETWIIHWRILIFRSDYMKGWCKMCNYLRATGSG